MSEELPKGQPGSPEELVRKRPHANCDRVITTLNDRLRGERNRYTTLQMAVLVYLDAIHRGVEVDALARAVVHLERTVGWKPMEKPE